MKSGQVLSTQTREGNVEAYNRAADMYSVPEREGYRFHDETEKNGSAKGTHLAARQEVEITSGANEICITEIEKSPQSKYTIPLEDCQSGLSPSAP